MGRVAEGTTLAYGDGGSPESFTTLSGTMDLESPGFSVTAIEFSSTDATKKSYEPGKPAIKSISVNIEYDPDNAAHAQMLTDIQARTKRNWKITIADTSPDTEVTFEAFLTEFGNVAIADDGKLTAPMTLQPTQTVTVS